MVYGMTGTEWQYGDVEFNYTSDEIKNNIATKIHEGLSDERKQELLLFWAGLYNVSKKDSTYAAFEYEAYNNVRNLEKLKNIPKDLSKDALESNTDSIAFNNAMNEVGVIGKTQPSIPPSSNESSGTITYDRELIKIIVSAAKFYINHIPTYQGKLKAMVDDGAIINYENDLAYNHLADNLLEYPNPTNTDNIKYSADHKIKTTKTVENGKPKATREFNTINMEAGKPMYFSPSMGYYKWKDIINNGNLYQVKTDFTGWDYTKDDCSGSIEFVLNIRESENNALYNTGITTNDLMLWQRSTAEALYNKGWVCYYRDDSSGKWSECFGTTLDKTIDNTNEIKTKGVKFLQLGDLLLCAGNPGHGEFYVGDEYTVDYEKSVDEEPDRDKRKKSGISKITAHPNFSQVSGLKAEGTFAWGNVKDEFPVESSSGHKNYFYYDPIANIFRHCECGQDPVTGAHDNCDFNNREYTVIWRKK